MAAAAQHDTWSLEEEEVVTASLDEARAHDEYWQQAHAYENYFRPGLDYEDYAPAYCVGYIGHTQYRGNFDDAEKSLLANWIRLKGDSRLSLDEARMAIRAAWDRAAQPAAEPFRVPAPQREERSLQRMARSVSGWLGGVFAPPARPVAARRAQPGGVTRR